MTSMIDVVFLLLIFFLVTTTFIQPEKEVPSNIRVEDKDAVADPSLAEPAIVDIVLTEQQVWFRLGAVRTNNLEEISRVLEAFENKSEGAFVRVDGEVPYEFAAQTIGVCKAAGFTSVSYLPLNH